LLVGCTTAYPFHVLSEAEVAFEITPEANSVRLARERVVEAAEIHLSPSRQAELRLVASEVITNAVRHGSDSDPVQIRALLCDGFLCVKVTDEGVGIAPTPRATAPDRDGGFGLVLVETLSRRWGMTREAGRTRIWFEFDLDS
jgi:anti-sigma regulatory factor (Ser/Thr protein kinase)